MSKTSYIPDPATVGEPLRSPEIDSMLANPNLFGRETSNVRHLLLRVKATIAASRTQIQQLNRDLQEVRLASGRKGMATTLSPRDAVRYLSPAELSAIVDQVARHTLDIAERQRTQTEQTLRHVTAERARLKLVVTDLLDDARIPDDVKTMLTAVLEDAEPVVDGDTSWTRA